MKTSRFTVLIAAVAMAGAAFADADSFLWLMAPDDAAYGDAAGSISGTGVDYLYAKVKGDDYLSFYGSGGAAGGTELLKGYSGAVGFDSSDSPSSFMFELYNSSDKMVGWTALSYSQAAQYIYADQTRTSETKVYEITNVVPEPSSALLLLLGMAGLGLKRRRV